MDGIVRGLENARAAYSSEQGKAWRDAVSVGGTIHGKLPGIYEFLGDYSVAKGENPGEPRCFASYSTPRYRAFRSSFPVPHMKRPLFPDENHKTIQRFVSKPWTNVVETFGVPDCLYSDDGEVFHFDYLAARNRDLLFIVDRSGVRAAKEVLSGWSP
ncbi:MAG: hypothetical protein IJ678_03760 [Kiritimatiellae bacterium]|nr:hypothetical protein [Kiritimatiellia bacterium]